MTHSSGLGDPGSVQWLLALCLLAAWIVVFLCMLGGIHSSGKVSGVGARLGMLSQQSGAELCPVQVVYITATFPYLVLLILIIRGATLPGSLDGVRFYLSSDWSKLLSAQVTPRCETPRWGQWGQVGPDSPPWPRAPRYGAMRPRRSSTRWASALGGCSPWPPTTSLTTTLFGELGVGAEGRQWGRVVHGDAWPQRGAPLHAPRGCGVETLSLAGTPWSSPSGTAAPVSWPASPSSRCWDTWP